MEAIKNGIKSGYFQAVNFLQDLPDIVFGTIWLALLALTLICVLKFFKEYNGTQKEFVKVSMIVLSIIFFVCLVLFTYIRK